MEEVIIKAGKKERMAKVAAVTEKLKGASSLVLNDYRGLSVAKISELRRDIAPLGASLHVEKNKLVKIALEQEGFDQAINELLTGPTAIAYVNGDVSPVLKVLFKYSADKNISFFVKGACIDGTILDAEKAEAVSKLPSREQLIAQLMGVMNAPVRDLAMCMNDVVVRMARVLQAVADSK